MLIYINYTKRINMRYLLLSFILFICNAHAEEIFPAHCTPFVVEQDLLNIPTLKSTVVMIHNLSKTDLWITSLVADANTDAGWSSRLQAGHWSALVLNHQKLDLSCIESIPGHEQQVSCANVLAVCQWPASVLPKKSADTVWAGEDMLLSPLIAYIKRHGFVLASPVK